MSDEDRSNSIRGCSTCMKPSHAPMLCSGCKEVYYCDVECQRKDWPNHKLFCAELRLEASHKPDDYISPDTLEAEVPFFIDMWAKDELGIGFFHVMHTNSPFKITQYRWVEFGTPLFASTAFECIKMELEAWCKTPQRKVEVFFIFQSEDTSNANVIQQTVILPEDFMFPPPPGSTPRAA